MDAARVQVALDNIAASSTPYQPMRPPPPTPDQSSSTSTPATGQDHGIPSANPDQGNSTPVAPDQNNSTSTTTSDPNNGTSTSTPDQTSSTPRDYPVNIKNFIHVCASSAVHPIFAKNRWIGLSDEDWVRFSPAFVLAYWFMCSPQVLQFWYTCLFAPRTATQFTSGNPKFPGVQLERIALRRWPTVPYDLLNVNAHERQQVFDALMALTNFLVLEVHPGPESVGHGATTVCTEVLLAPDRPGMASRILLSEFWPRNLTPLPADMNDLYAIWFTMAVMLVHELTHALGLAMRGTSTPEPVFEDDSFDELGAALEVHVFGCGFRYIQPHDPPVPPLPDVAVITPRGVLVAELGHTAYRQPRTEVLVVDRDWIKSLFGNPFWTNASSDYGALCPWVLPYGHLRHAPDMSSCMLE